VLTKKQVSKIKSMQHVLVAFQQENDLATAFKYL